MRNILIGVLFVLLLGCGNTDDTYLKSSEMNDGGNYIINEFQRSKNKEAYSRLEDAGTELNKKNYDKAIELYKGILVDYSDEYEAYHGLGTSYYYVGDIQSAEDSYKSAVKLNPNMFVSLAGLSAIESKQKNYTKALQYIDKAVKVYPKFGAGYFQRAHIKASMGNYSGAIEDYKKTIELIPQSNLALQAEKRIQKYSQYVNMPNI